ncbi:hypothetical protein FB446DRAFT_795395 [Lentinula raphanica]|nr:hypothetical protein FB446DRAFT_795395 [Lentinula raphanica]
MFRADAGARVTSFPGNVHKKYDTYEQALAGWRQHCRGYHEHPAGFIDGTMFVNPDALTVPKTPPPITPPPAEINVGGVLEEFMHVEWSKAYSCVQRWSEELGLIEEERRRVLVTLEHEALQWEGRQVYEGPLAATSTDTHLEGVRAYALSQAHLYRQIAWNFRRMWETSDSSEEVEDLEEVGEMDPASEDEEEDEAGIFGEDDIADVPDE